jgi:predicted ATP-dependent serine protease
VGKSTLLLQMAAMLTQANTATEAEAAADLAQEQRQQQAASPPPTTGQQQQQPQDTQQQQQQQQGDEGGNGSGDGSSVAAAAPLGGSTVLYVSGEESVEQIGSRGERMGPAVGSNPAIYVYSATRLDSILDEIIRLQPSAVVVDSIQTVYLDEVSSSAGSVTQVRWADGMLVRSTCLSFAGGCRWAGVAQVWWPGDRGCAAARCHQQLELLSGIKAMRTQLHPP